MTTVYEALRKSVKGGATPDEAADQLIAKMRKADLAALVRPLLVVHAQRYSRIATAALEREVDRRIAEGEDPISVRRKLSESSFALPDGRYVTWLDATADDHRARAAWQRGQAASCVADAERHEVAAAAIEAAGVSCLREIEHGDEAAA